MVCCYKVLQSVMVCYHRRRRVSRLGNVFTWRLKSVFGNILDVGEAGRFWKNCVKQKKSQWYMSTLISEPCRFDVSCANYGKFLQQDT